jgi:hypothetical protein
MSKTGGQAYSGLREVYANDSVYGMEMHTAQTVVCRHCQDLEFILGEVSCRRRNFLSNPTPHVVRAIQRCLLQCACSRALERYCHDAMQRQVLCLVIDLLGRRSDGASLNLGPNLVDQYGKPNVGFATRYNSTQLLRQLNSTVQSSGIVRHVTSYRATHLAFTNRQQDKSVATQYMGNSNKGQ